LSRQHATIHIARDGAMTIEDMGSSNGTSVRERQLEAGKPVAIAPGEVVDLGATMIVVQTRGTMARPRRLWAHDTFEAPLHDDCERAEKGGKPFALLRLHCAGPGDEAQVVQAVLFERLPAEGGRGAHAPGGARA